jgi:hypothetical protein
MSSWPNLPLELLIQVLKRIDRRDIIQCQLVCRSWIRATQVALYRDSVLTSLDQATGFLSTIVSSPSYPGKHVQSLTLSKDLFTEQLSVWDPLNLFTSLVEYCPNLEILKLERTFKPFWVRLLHERNSGNWTLLKNIPMPMVESEIEYYVYAAISLKDTLETLQICDALSSNIIGAPHDLEFKTLAKRLKDFKSLISLDIKHHTEKKLIEMDALIEDCQSLKELNVALYPTQVQPVNSESETVTEEVLQMIKPRPKITKLTVTTAIKSESTFKYIMRKFPSLSSFFFNETTTKKTQKLMKANRFRMSNEVIDQLIEYLSKIRTYTVSFLYIDNISKFIGSLAESDLIRLSRLAVCYDVDDMNDDELDNNPRMKLEKRIATAAPTAIVIYRANCSTPVLPHMRLLEEVGAKLVFLLVDLGKRVEYMEQEMMIPGSNVERSLKGYFVDQALQACKKLNILRIFGGTLMSCNPDRTINESVKELELLNCKIQAQVLTELAVRMPNLKTLTLRNCEYLTSGGQVIVSRNYVLIDTPYASLQRLRWMGPAEHTTTADHFLIKISTPSGEQYYKANERLLRCGVDDYNSVLRKKEYLKFHIRCTSIEAFVVKYAGFDRIYMINSCRVFE